MEMAIAGEERWVLGKWGRWRRAWGTQPASDAGEVCCDVGSGAFDHLFFWNERFGVLNFAEGARR
jgi:hypothetical protein